MIRTVTYPPIRSLLVHILYATVWLLLRSLVALDTSNAASSTADVTVTTSISAAVTYVSTAAVTYVSTAAVTSVTIAVTSVTTAADTSFATADHS